MRVLWMSTHGCFLPPFPLSFLSGCRNQMLESRSQTPPSTTTPTTGGAYYYVQPADDDQE